MTIQLSHSDIRKIVAETNPKLLELVESFLLFVGHAHSGHSIIGAILDAHSKVALANEVNIVKTINEHNLDTNEIFSILLNMSLNKKQPKSWHNSEYRYDINATHQGLTNKPTVIGDKKAGGTTRILFNNPDLINKLLEKFKHKLKIIFVQRTPIEIVASYAYYMKQDPCQFHVTRYIENMETVNRVQAIIPTAQWLTIDQKLFLKQPDLEISKTFKFLNLCSNNEEVKIWTKHVNANIKSKASFIEIPHQLSKQLDFYSKE